MTKPKGKSGNHPAVVAYREKEDSINADTMPALEALNARLDRALEKAATSERTSVPSRPQVDPRREPEEELTIDYAALIDDTERSPNPSERPFTERSSDPSLTWDEKRSVSVHPLKASYRAKPRS